MILIIDCTHQDLPLLKHEFVFPIKSIVEQAGFSTNLQPLQNQNLPDGTQGIILSGTALIDHQYLHTGLPSFFDTWDGPVLGICAGMQLLALFSGGILTYGEEIGMTDVAVVSEDPIFSGSDLITAWELHQSKVSVPESCLILATSPSGIQAFRLKDKPWYGVLFHPEVRNEWIIHNFLRICTTQRGISSKCLRP